MKLDPNAKNGFSWLIMSDILCEMDRGDALHPHYPKFDTLRRTALVVEEAGEALKCALDISRDGCERLQDPRVVELYQETLQTVAMGIRSLEAMRAVHGSSIAIAAVKDKDKDKSK